MAEPFLAQIIMFGGNFAPRGWAFCDGQLLPISQYSALFSILGTTYGGDGRTTFALPDLRGRVPMHPGNGPGLSDRRLGQKGGSETVTLTVNELPNHNHSVTPRAYSQAGETQDPTDRVLSEAESDLYSSQDPDVNMKSVSTTSSGGGRSFNIEQPYLCVNFIIALQGVFPSRS